MIQDNAVIEDNNDLLKNILQFLREMSASKEDLSSETGPQIDPDTDLIEAGIVDSLSIMELIVFLEEETGMQVLLEDLLLDSIRTARTIAAVYGPATLARQ